MRTVQSAGLVAGRCYPPPSVKRLRPRAAFPSTNDLPHSPSVEPPLAPAAAAAPFFVLSCCCIPPLVPSSRFCFTGCTLRASAELLCKRIPQRKCNPPRCLTPQRGAAAAAALLWLAGLPPGPHSWPRGWPMGPSFSALSLQSRQGQGLGQAAQMCRQLLECKPAACTRLAGKPTSGVRVSPVPPVTIFSCA